MENNKELQDFSIKNALIISLVYVVMQLLLFLMGISYFGGFWHAIPFTVALVWVLVISFRLRKLNGGYIEFKKALKFIYLALIIIELSSVVFNVLMYKVIDPKLDVEMKQLAIQETEKWMEKFSQPQDKIDDAINKVKAKDTSLSISNLFLGLGISLVFDFLVAALFSAIVKKDKMVAEMEGGGKIIV